VKAVKGAAQRRGSAGFLPASGRTFQNSAPVFSAPEKLPPGPRYFHRRLFQFTQPAAVEHFASRNLTTTVAEITE